MADLVSPPTVGDLAACGCTSHIPTAEYYRRGAEQFLYLPDRCVCVGGRPGGSDSQSEALALGAARCDSRGPRPVTLIPLGREVEVGVSGVGRAPLTIPLPYYLHVQLLYYVHHQPAAVPPLPAAVPLPC